MAFRVWAPERRPYPWSSRLAATTRLPPSRDGYFSGTIARRRAGTRYRFRLEQDQRFIPTRRRASSRTARTGRRRSSTRTLPLDATATGPASGSRARSIYEMHVGTFTPRGHLGRRGEKLPLPGELGHHVDRDDAGRRFPGRFGWGYDGVDLFAPTRLYGTPGRSAAFVDRPTRSGSA